MRVSTLLSRTVDPVIPKIAADVGVDVKPAALPSSALARPRRACCGLGGKVRDLPSGRKMPIMRLSARGAAALL
jgi:hypothetical protein